MGCEDANDAECGFPGYFAFPQVGIRSVFDQSCEDLSIRTSEFGIHF